MNHQFINTFNHFKDLEQHGKVFATYIWIGGNNGDLRSKLRVLDGKVKSVDELPIWNYDGSSTNQAVGKDSEVLIRPQKIYKDPFLKGDNILVFCDTYKGDKPHPSNKRVEAMKIFKKYKDHEPWYGFEQEYFMFKDGRPLGWPTERGSQPAPQGPYYCAVGSENVVGRLVSLSILKACTYAGIWVTGTNAEVALGQWEIQVRGVGIEASDSLWVTRYIMKRVAEMFDIEVDIEPKPILGDTNGSGLHTNFSIKSFREEGGFDKIIEACEKLGKKHKEHIAHYGTGNEKRLTGLHETCSIHDFKYGVGSREASIRIPTETKANGRGYLEDRRPSSNMYPEVGSSMLLQTVLE